MGDETIQFASRFSSAVALLTQVAADGSHAALRKAHGAKLDAVVRDALDAVAAVYETGTEAVRNWPELRRRVLARIATTREALDRAGLDAETVRAARALVEAIESARTRR